MATKPKPKPKTEAEKKRAEEAKKAAAERNKIRKETAKTQAQVDIERQADEKNATKMAEKFYSVGSLGRMADPEKIAAVQSYNPQASVSTDMAGGTQNIADAQTAYEQSQVKDAYVADAQAKMQAGLEGISSPENQALREQALSSVRSQSQNAMRQLRASGGAMGVTGGAAAQAIKGILRGEAGLRTGIESKLVADNVAEKGRRLSAYGDYSNTVANSMAANKDSALKNLLGARTTVADYTLGAQKLNKDIADSNATNSLAVDKTNVDISKYNIDSLRDTILTNLSQQEKEKAGYMGTYYGEQGQNVARRTDIRGNALAKDANRIAEKGIK